MESKKKNVRKMSGFVWDDEHTQAALLLAEGHTYQYVADEIKKNEKTIRRWMADIEFAAEVDRLSVMTGIASRAERLRLAKRLIRQKTEGNYVSTEKDILDWLKFAQSETDGIKLDLVALAAAVGDDETPVA